MLRYRATEWAWQQPLDRHKKKLLLAIARAVGETARVHPESRCPCAAQFARDTGELAAERIPRTDAGSRMRRAPDQ